MSDRLNSGHNEEQSREQWLWKHLFDIRHPNKLEKMSFDQLRLHFNEEGHGFTEAPSGNVSINWGKQISPLSAPTCAAIHTTDNKIVFVSIDYNKKIAYSVHDLPTGSLEVPAKLFDIAEEVAHYDAVFGIAQGAEFRKLMRAFGIEKYIDEMRQRILDKFQSEE